MKKFDLFCNYNDLYELKPGWVARVPECFTDSDMYKWRFGPLAIPLMVAGTLMQMQGSLQEGREAKRIANARAAVDIENAKAARRSSVEKAKLKRESGQRLLATQKSIAASGNIMLNTGSPLVIEAETKDIITSDIGFILAQGRAESRYYQSSAAIEKARGKAALRKSKWDAISQGLSGFGSIALMGMNKKTSQLGSSSTSGRSPSFSGVGDPYSQTRISF